MPVAKLVFGTNQESGLEELAGASPVAMNVIVDAKGATRRRPCLSTFGAASSGDLGGEVTGLYVDLNGNIYAYVDTYSGGAHSFHIVAPDGSSSVDLTGALSIIGTRRPMFAETEAMAVFTDGDKTYKFEFSAGTLAELGGPPPQNSHIIANSLRLLVNNLFDVLGQVNFSAISIGSSTGGNETWTGSFPGGGAAGAFGGEARPDPVVALHENTNEVFLFGKTTLQVFAPDSSGFVYSPVATRENGCVAPYSVIKVDQVFAWLDHERRFVIGDGRSSKVISGPIQQTLDDMLTFSDCIGYRVSTGPADCLAWHFPADGRTFVYQLDGGWSQWSGWDEAANNWKPMTIRSCRMDPAGGRVIAGTSDGKLATVDFGTNTDLGEPVVAYVTTGFERRGTDRLKRCKAFRATFRRGQAPSDVVLVSYRDGLGPWGHSMEFELGIDGETNPTLVVRSLGVYRGRQWRVQFSGQGDYVLASAEEEYEILEQ